MTSHTSNSAGKRGRFVNSAVNETYFGPGCTEEMTHILERDGIKRAVVITGRSLQQSGTVIDRLLAALGDTCVGVFSETVPHVPAEVAVAAARFAKSKNADALISFGGSTQNDTAKAASWAIAENIDNPNGYEPYAIRFEYPDKRIVPPLTGRALPIYAAPTTLSAGEFTNIAGITDTHREKKLYQDRAIGARAVFLDPHLTVATPDWLWLSSGVKAIDHCVEAYLSIGAQPMTDALALQAFATLTKLLPECRKTPGNLAVRSDCQVAAWLSVAGLSNVSLGLSHGLGHQIGAAGNIPHGYTSCVVLPHVIGFNGGARPERIAILGEHMGLRPDAGGKIEPERVQAALTDLIRDQLQLPWRLRDLGLDRAVLPKIAQAAQRDAIVRTNPRPIKQIEDVVELLERAW